MKPLVSVVMPARNSERYIGEAIASVFSQSHRDWELIVVDDGSTDGTGDVVQMLLAREPRLRMLRLAHPGGAAGARNAAIALAEGRYIAFLDSDDLWLPAKLERQLELMERTKAPLSFTAYRKIDSEGNPGRAVIEVPSIVTYAELLKTNVIGCLTAVYDALALGKRYMPQAGHEDYGLWLAILGDPVVAVGINEPLACYRVHDGSVSRNKLRAAGMQWAVYRGVARLPFWQSLYYFLHYVYHGLKKFRLR